MLDLVSAERRQRGAWDRAAIVYSDAIALVRKNPSSRGKANASHRGPPTGSEPNVPVPGRDRLPRGHGAGAAAGPCLPGGCEPPYPTGLL